MHFLRRRFLSGLTAMSRRLNWLLQSLVKSGAAQKFITDSRGSASREAHLRGLRRTLPRLGWGADAGTGARATNGSESAATVVPASQFPQAPVAEGRLGGEASRCALETRTGLGRPWARPCSLARLFRQVSHGIMRLSGCSFKIPCSHCGQEGHSRWRKGRSLSQMP